MLKSKDQRKSSRSKIGAQAWVRLDGGFAVRSCHVVDLSDDGVQLTMDSAEALHGEFTLLMSRNAGRGKRARVKWRRGSKIGAKFV